MQSLLVALVLALISPFAIAIDTTALLVNFNDGKMSSTRFCPPNEWAMVQDTIASVSVSARRRLGQTSSNTHQRQLRRCATCGWACQLVGTGCPASGRRRALFRQVQATSNSTQYTSQCSAKDESAMNAALLALRANVSSTCQNLINARSVKCVATTTKCGIQAIHLINATSNEVWQPNLNATGLNFCKNHPVTFQADTQFYLGRVNFIVHGPNGYFANRTEDKEPYFMHSNVGADVHGTRFPVGNYTVTVTSEYDPDRAISFSFRANNNC